MRSTNISGILLAAVFSTTLAAPTLADPCGMVPPIYLEGPTPIARVGLQKTYVFFKDGVETVVIRPGFTGKADQFGMLIPFPTPPALRKAPDEIFAHIDKAIDPPEVVVDLTPRPESRRVFSAAVGESAPDEPGLGVRQVRILRQEAVGMYQIAVLEAGSSAALKRWMEDHGYKYPAGMDAVCDDYVVLGWCFVAVKTRVGPKRGVDPQPGIRKVDPNLPAGASFDGHVQAMGFRFHVDKLVVPMRLSAFNEGELRNVVYLLTDGPKRIRSIPEEYVVRQVSGEQLHRNVTAPLPLRIIGGTVSDIPDWRRKNLPQQRDPVPHNGLARELFAADLLAVDQNRLSHPHEEAEKALLSIGERVGLRGPAIDRLNVESLKQDRQRAVAAALAGLKQMTLTVIDGDFPREVLGGQNLEFAEYRMPKRRNGPTSYDAKRHGPVARPQGGVLHRGKLSQKQARDSRERMSLRRSGWGLLLGLILASAGLIIGRKRRA